jgi:hypothetical protein
MELPPMGPAQQKSNNVRRFWNKNNPKGLFFQPIRTICCILAADWFCYLAKHGLDGKELIVLDFFGCAPIWLSIHWLSRPHQDDAGDVVSFVRRHEGGEAQTRLA